VQLAETGGACGSVSDPEIVAGMKLLAETEGIFGETAGGVTIATVKQLVEQGKIHPDEVTVAFITGAGFKTVEAVAEALNPPLEIDANVDSFESAYRALQPAQGVA
jgi:threonine synthase